MYNITFLHHSSFLVETANYCLLFDYYTQNNSEDLIDTAGKEHKKWIIFASHGHGDHFDKKIFEFRQKLQNVGYVLSSDIPNKTMIGADVLTVNPHEAYSFRGISIKTLASNDSGVAFLVEADGIVIYHAGDLNWWHWNGESEEFNEDIKKSYISEINSLKGEQIDVAMVPVDMRLEDKYIWGLDYIMKELYVKWAFPMHFWGRFEVCQNIQNDTLAQNYKSCVKTITRDGESFIL